MKETHNNVAYKRILDFVDECSFVELFQAVTCRNTDLTLKDYQDESDGVITGYGLINGRLVFLYSQNPDVLHGSLGEMHCKKIVQLYAQAMKMGAPVIAMLDAEVRLYSATEGTCRDIPVDTFITGPGQTLLRPGEYIEALRFSPPEASWRMAYEKVGRRNALAISRLSACCAASARTCTRCT